jgi:hypothetical protein
MRSARRSSASRSSSIDPRHSESPPIGSCSPGAAFAIGHRSKEATPAGGRRRSARRYPRFMGLVSGQAGRRVELTEPCGE